MPLEDLSDPSRFIRKMRKDIKRAPVRGGATGGGDSSHPGTDVDTVQLGPSAQASAANSTAVGADSFATDTRASAYGVDSYAFGPNTTAIGDSAYAEDQDGTALGHVARSTHSHSTAIGADSQTTAANQIRLGTSGDTVSIPGLLDTPSARRLKQNVEPSPELADVFPPLYEWEYITRPGVRRIGPMADDLVGTDGERFVVRDDDGEVAGYAKCDLHTVQIAALLARIERLEEELRSKNG